jgi:hypothetical protein
VFDELGLGLAMPRATLERFALVLLRIARKQGATELNFSIVMKT